MEKVDTMKSNKFFLVIIFFTLNTLLFPISLSTIKGLNRLSNYNEIKDINVDNIASSDEIERINGIVVYVKNNKIFNGVLIARKYGQNITGIYFYKNGKNYGIANSYYENGQLYLTGNYVNDKIEGKSFEYYLNGKLKDERFYKNGVIINSMEYYQNGKKKRIFKTTEGLRGIITGYYEDGIHKSSEMSVIQEYDRKGGTNYIMDGESIAYDKKGQVLGIINYKDNKTTGLKQQAFKNGKLKYEYISASDKLEDLKMQDYYIEYFDNSEQIKLNCNELSRGNWRCKEYSKNGNFKREFDSPTFRSPNDWSFGINALLGIINILF
ncbi:hypothetical protein [Leptotrichia wadei]|uniref:toxin-antitoxin system YwqK family antitoxin n=1 Tax=Leptotrichia wadei TaxID=157687 RepID=UPI0028EB71ED|nr:hypothetical protein [Leptotrichia wadei]